MKKLVCCKILMFLFLLPLKTWATHPSQQALFSQLEQAGYTEVIEVPARHWTGIGGNRPYLIETGEQASINHHSLDIDSLPTQIIDDLSYQISSPLLRSHIHRTMEAVQVGNVLVCYRQKNTNENSGVISYQSSYSHCFLFPREIDHVVARLRAYLGDSET